MRSTPQEWQVGELSEAGPVREENQDRMCSMRVELGRVHIVADGMGGHKGGAMAAQLTIDGLRRDLDQAPPTAPVVPLLRRAFERTNQEVYRAAQSGDPETRGMGSTAVLLLICDRTVHIAHVGDSRAYLFRDGRLRRITTDHTRAQRMVEAAILTAEQARDHPSASVLERAVGIKPAVEVDVTEIRPIKSRDAFLLCSDGLSGCVSDGEIEAVLKGGLPASEIPKRLVDLALLKGSKDNITVQYLQYGQIKQGSSARILRWTAVAAVAAALSIGLIYLVNFYLEHRAAKLRAALKEAQQQYEQANRRSEQSAKKLAELQAELSEVKDTKKTIEQEMLQLNEGLNAVAKQRDAADQEKKAAADKVRELQQQLGNAPDRTAGSN